MSIYLSLLKEHLQATVPLATERQEDRGTLAVERQEPSRGSAHFQRFQRERKMANALLSEKQEILLGDLCLSETILK